MSHINIGRAGSRNVVLDLSVLIRTRLMVQANSGGGKSWLLRRLAEQLFGKIPVIIIDPEGEFASLREKYGYVLVGKGGETPADSRSAAMLAHKLLELRASAVCDLYELKPSERHHWVRLFLEALIDAPKKLWRPTIVIVDEAHTFCPEKGAGESEASDAMTSLPTRGRKRRFCAIWATQRLGKLRKDASAELLNRLIGPTFEDVDLKRAADLLSIRSEDRKDFDKQMRVLEPGNFFALGRAITKERLLVRVGAVETSHEIEDAKYGVEPPPPPDKVKALLPKLADLPKAAEEQAKTVVELRHEIRSLKAQLRTMPARVDTRVETKVVTDTKGIHRAIEQIERLRKNEMAFHSASIRSLVDGIRRLYRSVETVQIPEYKAAKIALPAVPVGLAQPTLARSILARPAVHPLPLSGQGARPCPTPASDSEPPEGLSKKQLEILRALAEFEAIGRNHLPRTWVAARAGASHRSSAYTNNLGALRSAGFIEYGPGSSVMLTERGRELAPHIEAPLSTDEMLESCLKLLTMKQQAILKALHEAHPERLTREELAERAGSSATSSAYTNNLGALRSAGMLEYGPSSTVRCADWLFID